MFIMLVGISGVGKSHYAKHFRFCEDGVIISSDEYRKNLLGDENNQEENSRIFEQMRKDTISYLEKGKTVIYDATNLSRKYRLHLLTQLKHKFPEETFECVVITADPVECIERQKNRSRKVSEEVIWKQVKNFQVPYYELEPWDKISVIFNGEHTKSLAEDYLLPSIGFSQDNKYHTEDLFSHTIGVLSGVVDSEYKDDLSLVASWHDVGKLFTRTGEVGNYHYYAHENVSAWLFLCSKRHSSNLYTAFLINNHDLSWKGGRWWKALSPKTKKLLTAFNKYDILGSQPKEGVTK